jgi:tripartite-type tricarboxylate transporter receptor subunit TctC
MADHRRYGSLRLAALLAALSLIAPVSGHADAVDGFYKGRNLTILIGNAPGGGVDLNARLLARHFGKHIPGNPNLLPQNMVGGGGIKAVSYLYNAAPKDGSYIAIMLPSNALEPLMGNQQAKYDTFKFQWLGNMARDAGSCVFSAQSPVKSFDDLFKREVTIGATGPSATTAQHAFALRNVLGAKIKVILGYTGTAPIRLAMEKGEVDGMCSFWASLAIGPQAQDVKAGKLRPIVQMGAKKEPAFGNAAWVFDYPKKPADRAVLEFIYGQTEVTRPFAAPPGVPADRIEAMRTAFMATMKDPEFLADAKKAKLLVDPMDGKETEAAFRRMLSAPKDVVARATKAIRK